ncbi:MAG TPA: DUF488 domain-containing protein [Candidatus Saccharimonadales bacterium]|nr:DUF488 domain-containing protein [Candidatus Saccharimonadales bacterium]
MAAPLVVVTIGHSTRPFAEFLALLQAHAVQRVVDVRTIPRSRHNPQFGTDQLAPALDRAGIGYTHLAGLGGLRRPRPDSINKGWRNAGFRGFADYMQTPAFERHLEECLALARRERIALMCAEAVPWRCHRSLIADALVARAVDVRHITGAGPARPHALTPFARVDGVRITYPEPGTLFPEP